MHILLYWLIQEILHQIKLWIKSRFYFKLVDRPRVSIKKEGRYNVIEGNAMVLYCNIDSDPKEVNISWFKKESQGDIEMGTGTKLQLNVVTRRDSGLYVCIAENAIGKGLSGTSITVMCKCL